MDEGQVNPYCGRRHQLTIITASARLGFLSQGSYVAPSPQRCITCERPETELTHCPVYGFKLRVILAKDLTLVIFYACAESGGASAAGAARSLRASSV